MSISRGTWPSRSPWNEAIADCGLWIADWGGGYRIRNPKSAIRNRGVRCSVRVVLQRVSRAAVRVDGRVTGSIGVGFLALAGFAPDDTEERASWVAAKILGVRW